MLSYVGCDAIAENPFLAFLMARVSSSGLVAIVMAMVSNYHFFVSCYLIFYEEEHHGVGGRLIVRLNNCDMMAYATLVITV